jgi:pyrroloquinoline quinone biosynthesis protein B
LNASPDLRGQIEAYAPLRGSADAGRGTAIEGVLLTNADLDHTLGLLLMREGERIVVFATQAVRDALKVLGVLDAFCGIEWQRPSVEMARLLCRDGKESGLSFRCIRVASHAPRYLKNALAGDYCVGYRIVDDRSGGRLLFLPDVASVDDSLRDEMHECDLLLFDGTFWSENELQEKGCGSLTAAEMGHVPISGPRGSLRVLRESSARHRVYVHLNNTNAVLMEDSPQRKQVEAAGAAIGRDMMEFIL